MGDFTAEQIFRCTPQDADEFAAAQEVDVAFAALSRIYEYQGKIAEVRGYSYDHSALLPLLINCYGDPTILDFDTYVERPCTLTRMVAPQDVPAQSDATMDVLAGIANAPGRLLPDLHDKVRDTLLAFEKFSSKPLSDSVFAKDFSEGHEVARHAADHFAMTADDVLQLFNWAAPGGFYPGDEPEALREMSDRHAPRSNLLVSFCRTIAFLKTSVAPLETAAERGEGILYLQTYGT